MDVNGEARPQAGPTLTSVGLGFLAWSALSGFNLVARRRLIIQCFCEGVECRLIGRTSLDRVPLLPGFVRFAWKILSLQGFRTQCLRTSRGEFQGAQVGGIAMNYVLWLKGSFTISRTGVVSDGVAFDQVEFIDHSEPI